MKRLLLLMHLYLGLTSALFLIAISLSGAVIAFEPELNRLAHPNLTTVEPAGGPVDWDRTRALVERQAPGWKVIRFYFPARPGDSTYLRLRSTATHRIRHIYANQYTGKILGSTEDGSNWIIKVHDLHVNLLSGKIGNMLVTAATLMLGVLSITGIALWWPLRIFRPRRGRSNAGTNRDLHTTLGFWSCTAMFAFSVTGLALHYQTGKLLTLLQTGSAQRSMPGHGTSIGGMLRSAQEALPGTTIPRLILSERPDEPVFVYQRFPEDKTPAGRSFTTLNPRTGAVISSGSSRKAPLLQNALVQWTREVHTGTVLGLPTKILAVFFSLLLTVLAVTGQLIWINRERAKRIGRRALDRHRRSAAPTQSQQSATTAAGC